MKSTYTRSPEPITDRRLNIISLVLVLGAIATILDTTIVNIALNYLHMVFHAPIADVQWIATGYLLAFVSVIPLTGWVSERFGARRAWMFGVSLFMIASLFCGLANSLPALIFFRVLQGIGGGMVLPITITILTHAAGKERIGHAMVAIALPGQLAPILGPVIGGSIVSSLSWHWLFFVNIPICLAALVLGRLFLPAGSKNREHQLDVLGFSILTPGVVALAYGLSQATGVNGFGSVDAWLPIVVGVALLSAFTFHSLQTKRHALLDVRMFARRSFGLSSVITFVCGFSSYALMFLLPFFYQQVHGASVMQTGLLLIPQGLGTMAYLLLSKRLGERFDGRTIIMFGVILTMIGLLPFAVAGHTSGQNILLVGQFIQGFGIGAASLPVMTLAFASLNPQEVSRGSAAFSLVQRVGAPFGVTIIAVLLQAYLSHTSTSAQVAAAFSKTFWWIFGLSLIPLLLARFIPARKATAVPPQNSLLEND